MSSKRCRWCDQTVEPNAIGAQLCPARDGDLCEPAKQLLTQHDATLARKQHTLPCADCPWARTALPGWLGGLTADEWLDAARSDARIDCHTRSGAQCAGAAIYRGNICKRPRDPSVLRLASDPACVFRSPQEFLAHHERVPKLTAEERARLRRVAEPRPGDGPVPASTRYRPYLVLVRLRLLRVELGRLVVTPAGLAALRQPPPR